MIVKEKLKKVLIIDDSALTRAVLEKIIGSNPDMEVVGTAINPIIAARKIQQLKPDVITLDLVMPGMDGLTFLKKIKKATDIPVIVISGNSPKSSQNAVMALELGAFDIIEKPDVSTPHKLEEVSDIIYHTINSALESNDSKKVDETIHELQEIRKPFSAIDTHKIYHTPSSKFYVLGSSTGGPELLKAMLKTMDTRSSGMVIAQHMPESFTKSFAQRLDQECDIEVRLAKEGSKIVDGRVYIIPGNHHGIIDFNQDGYYIKLHQGEKVNRHRPSVDVLFKSAATVAGSKATGILLSGMGADGANGMMELKNTGARTIAQDKETCIVYGMPKQAIEKGATTDIMTPTEIMDFINQNIQKQK